MLESAERCPPAAGDKLEQGTLIVLAQTAHHCSWHWCGGGLARLGTPHHVAAQHSTCPQKKFASTRLLPVQKCLMVVLDEL